MARRHYLCLLLAGLAGCKAPPSPTDSEDVTGLTLRVELVAGEPDDIPRAVKVTFKNSTGEPVAFHAPWPMGDGVLPEDATRLSLVLIDSSGRESRMTPVLTELEANMSAPESRTLAAGESWSKDYELEQFYFWNSCGPVLPITDFMAAGRAEAQLQVMVTPARGRSDPALRSQPVKLPCAVAPGLFGKPGSPGAEAGSAKDDADNASAEEAQSRGTWTLHGAALRAMRRKYSIGRKEPEQGGKPITHWLEQYCDESLEWVADDEPAAAPRIQARDAVLRMGTRAVPFLMTALEVQHRLGDCAVALLHELHEAGKVPDQDLVDALTEGPEEVRTRVVRALDADYSPATGGRRPAILSPGLVAALVKTSQDHESEFWVRQWVASALGRPGLKEAVPALTDALRDNEQAVRSAAARALAAIGPDARGALPVLKSLAVASTGDEKIAASRALLALGEKLPDVSDFCDRMASHFHERLAQGLVKDGTEAELADSFRGVDAIFFVVDGWKGPQPGFRFAQRFIPKVLSTLGEDAEFGIVFMDYDADSHPKGGKPARARKDEKALALEFVLKALGGWWDCTQKGFEAALDYCEAARAQRKVILYIGDADWTCEGEEEMAYRERVCEEVTRKNGGRAEIHAIGYAAGPCGQGTLLYLTERNGGRYTRLVR